MMEHITTDQLIDYIHGALAAGDDASVHTHLGGCAPCRNEYAAEVRLTEMLRDQASREMLEMPSAIKAHLWQSIRASKPSWATTLQAWLRPAYALPVAAALIVAAALLPTYLGHHANAPLIDAAYYLQDHAAMNGSVPFADRSGAMPAEFETGSNADQTAVSVVPGVYIADASRH